YRITRAEGRLLARFAPEMVEPVGDPVTLTELGCGSGEKDARVADAPRARRPPRAARARRRQRREGRDDRRRAARPSPAGRRAPDRHLAIRPRELGAAAR